MLSAKLLGRSALTMATGMPTTHDSTTESSAISAVSGPRRSDHVGDTLRAEEEWPKLPRRMLFTHAKYCTTSGSLRPSSAM